MGEVLNLQANIGRGVRDEEIDDQVGTKWEGTRLAKHISRHGTSLDLQDK